MTFIIQLNLPAGHQMFFAGEEEFTRRPVWRPRREEALRYEYARSATLTIERHATPTMPKTMMTVVPVP